MSVTNRGLASRLRHRVTLQQEVHTSDGAGGTTKTWSNISDLWAEIIPVAGAAGSALNKLGGKEVVLGDQVQAEISHKITLRYRSGVTPDMRLVYESGIFNIRYVAITNEIHQQLELLVQEGVGT